MSANLDRHPRVYLYPTANTATSVAELEEKPQRRCDIILESANFGARGAVEIANNVPWAYAHTLKATLEGMLELAFSLQADPPPRADSNAA